jgi:hypothetical protein
VNDREFWIQIRRGLIVMLDAIDVRFALNTVRSSAPASLKDAPPESLAQAAPERISTNGVRNR